MRVMLFGATGMVGQGVLRECLRDPQVTRVLAVGRRPTGVSHPKLTELVRRDFHDWSDADDALTGYDACFFTLGVSAAGMSEADYTRTTYDLTRAMLRVAREGYPRPVLERADIAAVVLGNPSPSLRSGSGQAALAEDVDVLTRALDDPEPLVREHSAWALERLARVERS